MVRQQSTILNDDGYVRRFTNKEIYMHISKGSITQVESPLDKLGLGVEGKMLRNDGNRGDINKLATSRFSFP